MSSSLFNEGYGNSYSQAELPYTPGPYEGFPTGQEPDGVKIGVPASTLIIEEGDEIRFANNENYSYKVNTVSTPQSNIHPDGAGYIKLELDRPIPASINKDFFLVRRYIESAGSVFIDLPYPYTNKTVSIIDGSQQNESKPFSSAGILFPDYPILELETSASIIVNNLISKGVIQS
tara:strand:- start:496 stop:1023 length:528 start_codon:yes stop_codon:yes gene_type:complete